MNLKSRPKLRISLYHYGFTFWDFLVAFRKTALKAGWNEDEIYTVVKPTFKKNDRQGLQHLLQYACIVKLPKGYRVKNGKPINKKTY